MKGLAMLCLFACLALVATLSLILFLGRETESEKALPTAGDVFPFEYEVHTFQVPKDLSASDIHLLEWLEAKGIVKQYGTERVVYQMDIKRLHQHKKELLEIFTIGGGRVHRNVLEGLTRAAIAFNDKEIVRFLLYSSAPEGSWSEEWEREQQRWLALGKIAYAIPVTFSEVFSEQPVVHTFTVQSESLNVEYLSTQQESYLSELERVGASEEVKEMMKRRGIGYNRWASVGGNIHFLEWLETKGIVEQTGKKRDKWSNEVVVYQMDLKKAHQHRKELCAQFKMVGGDAATNILYGLIRAAIAFNDKEIVRFFIYLPGPDGAGTTNKSDILRQIKDAIPIIFLHVLLEQPKEVQRNTIQSLFDPPIETGREWAKIRMDRQFRKEDLVLIKRYNALVDEVHGALVDELYGE